MAPPKSKRTLPGTPRAFLDPPVQEPDQPELPQQSPGRPPTIPSHREESPPPVDPSAQQDRIEVMQEQINRLAEAVAKFVQPPVEPPHQVPAPVPGYPLPGESASRRPVPPRCEGDEQSAETPALPRHQKHRDGLPERSSYGQTRSLARGGGLEEKVDELLRLTARSKSRTGEETDDPSDTEPPFTEDILNAPVPKGFKMPAIKHYDGTTDPIDHWDSFKTLMLLHGVPDAIMCRAFPATLENAARAWFSQLKPGSVSSFRGLRRSFLCHFASSKRHRKTTGTLMSIEQGKEESLRDYVARFTQAALDVKNLNPAVAMAAIARGARSSKFTYSLHFEPPETLSDLLKRAEQFMNADECMGAHKAARGESSTKRKNAEEARSKGNHGGNGKSHKKDRSGRRSPPRSYERYEKYTPLNASREHILMEVADRYNIKWPGKMMAPADKRDRNLYCRFHRDHGHETEECRALKEEIEALIQRGHLTRYVAGWSRPPREEQRRLPAPERREPERRQSPDRRIDNRPLAGVIQTIYGGPSFGGESPSARTAYACQVYNVQTSPERA